MGANLNRLMKQYGVSTASKAPYLGKTEKDKAAYDTYSKEYDKRVLGTPMYSQTQFDTSKPPLRTKDKMIGGGPGLDLPDWIKPPPPGAIVTQAFEFITNPVTGEVYQVPTGGYSINEDAFSNMELTGSYYDDILTNPIYEEVINDDGDGDTIVGGGGNDIITLPPGFDLSGITGGNTLGLNFSNVPGLTAGMGYKWDDDGNLIWNTDSMGINNVTVDSSDTVDSSETITGGAGNDSIIGGVGNDLIDYTNFDFTQAYGGYNAGGPAGIDNITVRGIRPTTGDEYYSQAMMNIPGNVYAGSNEPVMAFEPNVLDPIELDVENIEIKASDLAPGDVRYQGQTFDEMKNALYGGAKKLYDITGAAARGLASVPVLGPLAQNALLANMSFGDKLLLRQARRANPNVDAVLKNYGFQEGGSIDEITVTGTRPKSGDEWYTLGEGRYTNSYSPSRRNYGFDFDVDVGDNSIDALRLGRDNVRATIDKFGGLGLQYDPNPYLNLYAQNFGDEDIYGIRARIPFQEGGDVEEVDIDVIEESTDLDSLVSENMEPAARTTRFEELRSMLNQPTSYDAEIANLSTQLGDSQTAFMEMINTMANTQSRGPSDAEKYFRLASAFGTPTQSGHFMENLALAGKELGNIKKETREAAQEGDALKLQGLQYGVDILKERLAGVKELSQYEKETMNDYVKMIFESEEEYFKLQDERAYDLKVLQDEREYDANKPKSEAAKLAADMGYERGSEDYNTFIKLYYDNQQKTRDLEIKILEQKANTLTNPEISALEKNDLKLQAADKAVTDLRRALELNDLAFTGNFYQVWMEKAKGLLDPNDPKYKASEELENLLAKAGLTQLKATFGGNISDGEREAILKIQGIESKGIDARRQILENALTAMESVLKKSENKRDDIKSGTYFRRTK